MILTIRLLRAGLVAVGPLAMASSAPGATALFAFDNGPVHVSLPLDVTVGGVTAHLSATGQGFSIQDPTQSIGLTPTGFTGFCLSPNSVFAADLLVSFPQQTATAFSIMVAPQELATDTTATMRVTAYQDGAFVGTNTSQGTEPFLWPTSLLAFNSAVGFNSVVIHYAAPPPSGGDYGSIFVADNMTVTATAALAAADFNEDFAVDGADLALWTTNFGTLTLATRMQGDANADGAVDGADLLTWQRQLAIHSMAAVPEPSALAIFALGAGWRLRRRAA